MRQKKLAALFSAACVIGLGSTGCNKAASDKKEQTTSATGESVSVAGKADDSKPGDSRTSGTASNTKAAAPQAAPDKPITAEDQLPKIKAAQHRIDLVHMPDNLVICTIDTVPITVGEYRRQFRIQADQVRAQLSANQQLQEHLLTAAKADNIVLSDKEKKGLTANAKKALTLTGGVLTKYLKDSHMSEQDFDQQVLNLGLAEKTACMNINSNLLGELVDRELLCAGARQAGLGPAGFNKYSELKKTPQYDQLMKSQMMNADQLKDEIIKTELLQLMINKLQEKAPASDQQIAEYYKKNQDKFIHPERIRLSQIFIAAPQMDSQAGESVRSQVKKKNPNMSDAEVDAETKTTMQELRKHADDLVVRAVKGEDFAKLANEYTDDIPVRTAKIGGDMGFQDRDKLIKDFADRVLPLKPGQVFPKVIQSQLGFHIIKVSEKQPPGTMPLSEVKGVLKQALTQNNATMNVAQWLYDQRKNSQIALSPELQQLVSAPQKPAKAATAD